MKIVVQLSNRIAIIDPSSTQEILKIASEQYREYLKLQERAREVHLDLARLAEATKHPIVRCAAGYNPGCHLDDERLIFEKMIKEGLESGSLTSKNFADIDDWDMYEFSTEGTDDEDLEQEYQDHVKELSDDDD